MLKNMILSVHVAKGWFTWSSDVSFTCSVTQAHLYPLIRGPMTDRRGGFLSHKPHSTVLRQMAALNETHKRLQTPINIRRKDVSNIGKCLNLPKSSDGTRLRVLI